MSVEKSMKSDNASISENVKCIKDECIKISSKLSGEQTKDWWRDADAIIRIGLCVGLVVCMVILSCSMRVEALKDLSDKADASVKKCDDISHRLHETVKKADQARNSICQFHDGITNKLKNALYMISDLSNKIEQVNIKLSETKKRGETNGNN
ncbi:MAG: hypothetical protein IJV91_02755 [Kiritimatiellae bacterium]|nr:hypothetical protein [Kiritimatiellia bacterium]